MHARKGENSQSFSVALHLNYNEEQKSWKARIDELDSVLSLCLASIDKERELFSSTVETTKLGDDDDWFRKRNPQARGGLILLGEYTPDLKQALDWWLPADAPKPEEIEGSRVRERYGGSWRVTGTKFREGHYQSPRASHKNADEQPEQATGCGSGQFEDENGENSVARSAPSNPEPATFFSIQSGGTLEQASARHIFHAFLWATASKMVAPIDQHSETGVVGTIIPGDWNNIRLPGVGLTRLAGAIRNSGLMDLNHAYLTLIPSLHAYARLGELHCVVETVLDEALQYEKILDWEAAYKSYSNLFDLAKQFREDSFTFRKTVAIVVEYMRTIRLLPKVPESSDNQFPVAILIHKQLSYRLSDDLYRRIRNDLKMLHERQYREPWMSTCNDQQRNEIINCGFTQLHHITAQHNPWWDRGYLDTQRGHPFSGDLTESEVALREIPNELQRYVRTQDLLGWAPLHYTAVCMYDEAPYYINSKLSMGADIDASDIRGWTPLHHSMWNSKPLAANGLLEKEANTKIAGVDGITPLHCAAAKMRVDMVNVLISHPRQRPDQFATDIFSRLAIHLAAQESNEDFIPALRPCINEKDQQGRTALHLAAFSGHSETIPVLVHCGADPNQTFVPFGSLSQYTALHRAAMPSEIETAMALLDSGANIDARCHARATPLHYACMEKSLEMVEILIRRGADVNAEDHGCITPLRHAVPVGIFFASTDFSRRPISTSMLGQDRVVTVPYNPRFTVVMAM